MEELLHVLTVALSLNLLQVKLDQKCKGRRWMVMYLNRYLCVHFGLPLGYGGWKEQKLSTLSRWIKQGYVSGKTDDSQQLELM